MAAEHLFLTGKIQIGKSTLIRRLLEEYSGSVSGFKTISLPVKTKSKSDVYILPPFGGPEDCRETNRIIHRDYLGQKSPKVFSEVFENEGCALLKNREEADLLLMDEIGIMEANAPAFQAELRRCVEGTLPILGVVRSKPHPFLDWIRSRPNVRVVEITEENRDLIFEELLEWMENRKSCRAKK